MKHQSKHSDRLIPQNESLKKGDDDIKQTAPDDGFSGVDYGEAEKEVGENNESSKGKEKYLREVANIEGLPDEEPVREDSPEATNSDSR